MITKLPNVDRAEMPELAELVDRYAMRYEFRLDGSSLWEGRACVMTKKGIGAVAQTSYDPEEGSVLTERMQRYPTLTIPAEWAPLSVSNLSWTVGCRYYHNAGSRSFLALNGMDVFLIHHPTEAGHRWELELIETALRETHCIVRPRDLFTGFYWVLAYREERMKVDGYWL
jgi:hypothetical protein